MSGRNVMWVCYARTEGVQPLNPTQTHTDTRASELLEKLRTNTRVGPIVKVCAMCWCVQRRRCSLVILRRRLHVGGADANDVLPS